MNFNAVESKSTINDVCELTENELQVVAGGLSGVSSKRAAALYKELQHHALYDDRI